MRKKGKLFLDDFSAINSLDDYFNDHQLLRSTRVVRDIAASNKTTAVAVMNQPFSSVIDKASDVDWVKLNLSAGHIYQIDLRGLDTGHGTLSDPFIKGIYGSNGKSLGAIYSDDDSGEGRNAHLTFAPTTSGIYYVAAAAYGKLTGSYSLLVSEDLTAPTLTSIQPIQDGAVAVNTNITIQFSEVVEAAGGSIHIIGDDGHQINILALDINQVQIVGQQVTINPSINLHPGITYTVSLDANAFKDSSGNAHIGLARGVYEFTTEVNSDLSSSLSDWTIMVYMAADNDLESYALSDMNELEQIANLSGLSITALLDRSTSYDSTNGNWSDTRVGAVQADSSSSVISFTSENSWGELDTGNSQTLTDFILWSVENRPAENYALVIWNHGGGIDGIAWDDSSNGYLTMNEISRSLNTAISSRTDDNLDKFGLIAMDACLMGMIEVAYPLTGMAEYVVLSEELVPGTGFAYDDWLSVFSSSDVTPLQLGDAALNSYANEYAWDSDITLSNLDMSQMGVLVDSLNQFTQLAINANSRDLKAISKAVAGARDYPSDQSYDFADLGHAMDLISTGRSVTNMALKNAASAVSDAVDLLVHAEVGTVSQASGVSIYLPYGNELISSTYNSSSYTFLQAVPLWDDFLRVI